MKKMNDIKYYFRSSTYIKKWIIWLCSFLFISTIASTITTSVLLSQHIVESNVLPPPQPTSNSLKNELNNINFVEPLQSPRPIISNPNDPNPNIDDALLADAKQKASTDSVLVYYVGWLAVFHKFGFLTHLLSVLEINPLKTIYIYADENAFDFNFLKNYKNIVIQHIVINSPFGGNVIEGILVDPNFLNQIEVLNRNHKIDFYLSDVILMESITNIMRTHELSHDTLNKIINQFIGMLYKTESINIFSDGTWSSLYFSNEYFHLFGKTYNAYSTLNDDYYLNQQYYTKFKKSVDLNSPIEITSYADLFYFLISPIVTKNKSNTYQKTKFFHTSINTIVDVNDNTDANRILTKHPNNYFDPYNSLNAGLIKLVQGFNDNQQTNLLKVLKVNVQTLKPDNVEFNFMDNALNLVYSGRLLDDLDELGLINECKKIIDLYNEAKDKYPTKNIQIIFKGHPRDSAENIILSKLKKYVAQITGSDINAINWIFTVNKNIPFELYLACDIFFDFPAKNREVKIYTTFSTISLMLYDYNRNATIENFLLSHNENNQINSWYGTNSTIFTESKRKIY